MDAYAMLTEVVKPRPDLFPLGAIRDSATKASIIAVLRHDFMDALLVPIKIVLRTETINLGAFGKIAFVRFFMSEDMLSGPTSFLRYRLAPWTC